MVTIRTSNYGYLIRFLKDHSKIPDYVHEFYVWDLRLLMNNITGRMRRRHNWLQNSILIEYLTSPDYEVFLIGYEILESEGIV